MRRVRHAFEVPVRHGLVPGSNARFSRGVILRILPDSTARTDLDHFRLTDDQQVIPLDLPPMVGSMPRVMQFTITAP